MGLESVELVMDIENAFAICIPDEEATSCTTVGKLIEIVQQRIGLQPKTHCATSRGFYRTRRALIQSVGLNRDQIRLDSKLEELIPTEQRRNAWGFLRQAGLALPVLRLSSVQIVAILSAMAMVAAISIALTHAVLPIVFGSLFLTGYAFLFASSFARTIPNSCNTVRNLVIQLPPCPLDPPLNKGLSREEVAQKVRLIISNGLGVPIEKVSNEARFVKDLGCR